MRFISTLLATLFILCAALVFGGCGTAPTVAHSSTPVTLGSYQAEPADEAAEELAQACDTRRARLRHTPVRLSDGTPVWCF